MSSALPLVTSAQLPSRAGQEVRIIGKVQKDENPSSEYVEVIGRVSRTGDSITQHAVLPLGDNLDLTLVDKLVKLAPQFPSLFGE
ncbi:hypothetical protein MCUN1_000587 [Malassezia cuniculi]|uniref:Replication factor A protein 3 n=1 Tax=Malassezia cuniculi TaxID=948313 RepID=A0AAF0ERG7_9BASI|nr:hypothetical protein MCUN1_000587 [Malassezia cuniculi]